MKETETRQHRDSEKDTFSRKDVLPTVQKQPRLRSWGKIKKILFKK